MCQVFHTLAEKRVLRGSELHGAIVRAANECGVHRLVLLHHHCLKLIRRVRAVPEHAREKGGNDCRTRKALFSEAALSDVDRQPASFLSWFRGMSKSAD
eukprot:scaffold7773_cov258-Pinguiococcus_pyrenoidosus.AAC.1